jgi:hypothetical protein
MLLALLVPEELDELLLELETLDQLELDTLLDDELLELLMLLVPEELDELDELTELVLTLLSELVELKLDGLLLETLDALELLSELDVLELLLELDDTEELLLELCELTLDWLLLDRLLELVELDELLDELDELDSSSIDRMDRRSSERGPGNWSEPVWKFNTAVELTSPVLFVSTRVACQIVLSVRGTTTLSAVPARVPV